MYMKNANQIKRSGTVEKVRIFLLLGTFSSFFLTPSLVNNKSNGTRLISTDRYKRPQQTQTYCRIHTSQGSMFCPCELGYSMAEKCLTRKYFNFLFIWKQTEVELVLQNQYKMKINKKDSLLMLQENRIYSRCTIISIIFKLIEFEPFWNHSEIIIGIIFFSYCWNLKKYRYKQK